MMERKAVHFVGIGGTGLSAMARVLLERGYQVTGSDRNLTPLAKALELEGVRVTVGHRSENIEGAQVVIRSSAIPDDNVEILAAREQGIPVMKRSDFLSTLMNEQVGIAVAGTHGKTTTTAMIAWMLTCLGKDPSFIVGGIVNNLGKNAHAGKGDAFVIEADEYDYMFLGLKPKLAVITNIEHDHPDCFPTADDFFDAFDQFATRVENDGTLLVCANDGGATRLGQKAKKRGQKVLTYAVSYSNNGSTGQEVTYVARALTPNQAGGMSFDAVCSLPGTTFELDAPINLLVPGRHNVQNALAALAVAHQLNLSINNAGKALSEFIGAGRRFEVRGEFDHITVIDDYAHHPTEIRATLSAARMRYPKSRIWVVWQPHTYSRTRLLFNDFISAFELADHVVVTEIYAAREPKPEDGFSAQHIVTAIRYPDSHFIPDFSQVTAFLTHQLVPGDVLIVLSAGDADQISNQVLMQLKERSEAGE